MAKEYILAIDAGTTSSRSIIFDKIGQPVASSQIEFNQIYPQKGWVEHDPEEIWETQLNTIRRVIQKANIKPSQILAIGITNQRETTVLWDKETGKPVYNAIVWQCRRTSNYSEKIKLSSFGKTIFYKTGLIVDPYFSATKIKWILDNVDEAKKCLNRGTLAFGTIDSWLLFKLTKGKSHKTDFSNASRTMLFNINEGKWDNELLDYFKIPEKILPEVVPSNSLFGYTDISIIGEKIPINGILGDQQAALFGQNCFKIGEAKMTYGTGGFILFNIGDKPILSENKLLTTIAWNLNGKTTYAIEGSVFIAGAAIQWLRDNLHLIDNAEQSETFSFNVDDNGGVYFIPAFTGLGAPYWNPYVRAAIFGITRDTKKEHIIRAAIEGIVFSTKDVVDAIEKDTKKVISVLKVDGGASKNNFLLNFLSDILGKLIIRPQNVETTALGAALIAGYGAKIYCSLEEISKIYKIDKQYIPKMDQIKKTKLYNTWSEYIKRLL